MPSLRFLTCGVIPFVTSASRTIDRANISDNSTLMGLVHLPEDICPASVTLAEAFSLPVDGYPLYKTSTREVRIGASKLIQKVTNANPIQKVISVFKSPDTAEEYAVAIGRLGLPFCMKVEAVFHPEHKELYLVHPIYTQNYYQVPLQQFIHDKVKLSVKEIGQYASQIAYGLWMLHRKKWLQRDMSVHTFALSADKEKLMFMDHSSAMFCKDDGQGSDTRNAKCAEGSEWIGSKDAWYMSPEMAEKRRYGFEADWWGFGHLMFQMAAGLDNPAFGKFTSREDKDRFLHRMMNGKIGWPRNIDAGLKLFLTMLLDEKSYRKWLSFSGELTGTDPSLHPVLSDPWWLQFAETKVDATNPEAYEDRIRHYWKNMCLKYAPDPFGESCHEEITAHSSSEGLCPPEAKCAFGEGFWKLAMSLKTKDGKEEWHKNRVMQINSQAVDITQPASVTRPATCGFGVRMAKTSISNIKSDHISLNCARAPPNTFHGSFTSPIIYECLPVEYAYKHSRWRGPGEWKRKLKMQFLDSGVMLLKEEGAGDGGKFEAAFQRVPVSSSSNSSS